MRLSRRREAPLIAAIGVKPLQGGHGLGARCAGSAALPQTAFRGVDSKRLGVDGVCDLLSRAAMEKIRGESRVSVAIGASTANSAGTARAKAPPSGGGSAP